MHEEHTNAVDAPKPMPTTQPEAVTTQGPDEAATQIPPIFRDVITGEELQIDPKHPFTELLVEEEILRLVNATGHGAYRVVRIDPALSADSRPTAHVRRVQLPLLPALYLTVLLLACWFGIKFLFEWLF